jgi:hypothetical protein
MSVHPVDGTTSSPLSSLHRLTRSDVPLRCSFSFGKRWKMEPNVGCTVGGPRYWIQGDESLQSFVPSCEASYCRVGGIPASCQDEFFECGLQFLQRSSVALRVNGGAGWHEFRMHYTINVSQSSEHDSASRRCDLERLWCWRTFMTVFHWLSPVSRLDMMHPAVIPGDSVSQEFVAFMFISQQLSTNVHPLLFQFLGKHSENSSHALVSVSEISSYLLYSLMWNGSFVCRCLLRNATSLLDGFNNAILVSLVGCCLPSPARCLSFRLACPRFALRTRAVQRRTVLMTAQSSPWTTSIHRSLSIGGTFSAIKNSTLCTLYIPLKQCLLTHSIFTAVMQRPLVSELWNFSEKCGKV